MSAHTSSGRFDGKVALVTGGASGIGAAIVRRLNAEGARVVIADLNAEALADAANAYGDSVLTATADVTDETAVKTALARAVEGFGGVDALFNVAGSARLGQIVDLDEVDWKFTVDTVLTGTFLFTKHAARAMRAAGNGGAIVNVSSLNAHVPLFGGSAYASAKAGVESFTKNAALELRADGIRVNAVLPGLVDTPMTAAFMGVEDLKNDFLTRIVSGRAASPDEIAAPALYLASDDASYVNGTGLVVDGGWEITNYPNLSPYL